MKTKKKMIAFLEIAIVLFSVFLVAIPAIAAEQNQAMQKVSATVITTASKDDYVLDIYGNANEDDTIDMGDVVYTKLAIFGKKPKTELCDAKYDGRINVLDVIQTKLIILGKEKELTVVDSADRIVTVKKPIERILLPSDLGSLEVVRAIKATDKIVAVSEGTKKNKIFYPEFADYPTIGSWGAPDYEAILEFQPDTIFMVEIPEQTTSSNDAFCKKMKELNPDITVVRLNFIYMDVYVKDVRTLGYILDRKDEAEEFIDFYEGYINTIEEKVRDIPEEDKPRVYHEGGWRDWAAIGGRYPSNYRHHLPAAGGKNIFSDLSGHPYIDPEEVMKRNPEVIIKQAWGGGYAVDDITGLINVRDGVMNRPELAEVTAVKDGRVYIVSNDICCCGGNGRFFLALGYMAKWLHPELFEDLDPQAFHQEYLTKFQGLDYDLDKRGAFVYPEPSLN